jgi:cytoskeletal protein CcmA (bactofilin family)
MKHTTKLLALILLLSLAILPTQTAYAKGLADSKVVFGGTFLLKGGETLDGDLVVLGGVATIEENATVTGNVVLVGGSLTVNGSVKGDTVVIAGAGSLGAKAVVGGDLVGVIGTLQRAETARVLGQVVNVTGPIIEASPSGPAPAVPTIPAMPAFPSFQPPEVVVNPLGRAVGIFFRSLVMAVLALLVVMFLPDQTQRVAQAATGQPLPAGGLGCLTVILAPVVVILLAITILLLPVAAIAVIGLVAAVIFGEIAIGLEVGQRLMRLFNREVPLPVSALLGTFLLTLLVDSVGAIWCLGWWAPLLLTILALGAVFLTRFGTRAVLPPMAPVPPAPPMPSAPPPAPNAPPQSKGQ